MKHPSQRDENSRFHGSLRHYHRSNSQKQRTWDEWVDAKPVKARSINWLKMGGITAGVLALIAIIVGLVIELM